MTALSRALSVLACCLALGPGVSFAEDVPDPSPNAFRFPDAVKAGPPDAIKPGTRLTYFGTSATVSGQRIRLVLDAGGNWVVKSSEKRFETGNSGGAGYTVLRVGYVDHDVAAVSTSTWLLNTLNNTLSSTGTAGFVSQAGCASVYWVHPSALAKLEDKKADGEVILRAPYVVNGHKYNAIRIATETEKNYVAQVFDLDTGLLVFYAAASISDATFTRYPNGEVQKVEGSTHTETASLMEAKDVDVPWKNSPAPAWAGTFREIRYEGNISTTMNGVEYSTSTSAKVTPRARGNGWLRYVSATVTENPGLPAFEGKLEFSAGNASVRGLWIPPQGLAALKEGQVIETNEVVHTRMVVARVADGHVTIRETGQVDQLDTTYDATSGLMSSVEFRQQNAVGTTITRLRMTGQK